MFSSNSIGVSAHKNEYAAGVRIGNWVEEQFGREAEGAADSLKAFMAAQEAAAIAASSTVGRAARADPKQPVDGTMLFSHGPEFGGKYQASSYALHFTDPASRVYGADSGDRVHKSFFCAPGEGSNPQERSRIAWEALHTHARWLLVGQGATSTSTCATRPRSSRTRGWR